MARPDQDDHKPLLNKAMDGVYPPGSTFKPVVALAAVDRAGDAGLSRLLQRRDHPGQSHLPLLERRRSWPFDLEGGIKNSCDVFFYETARRLGIDKIQEVALKLGMGAPTGIEVPGENRGFIPSRAWKLERYGVAWQQGDTLSAGIGQGYVTATPLQLCKSAASRGPQDQPPAGAYGGQ